MASGGENAYPTTIGTKFWILGKNPGLGIRSLHDMGIDGRNVGIAMIHMPMIVDHVEYGKQARLYEEINIISDAESEMHGPAVASIAVGKTIGVAPNADLYYIAAPPRWVYR